MSQVLCEHVSGIFVSFYVIENNLSVTNHLTDKVVAYINVFYTLFLDGVRSHKDGSLVVSIKRYGFHGIAYLFYERSHPKDLSASITKCHVFRFSGRECNGFLRSSIPGEDTAGEIN